jgi:hypothetical protein
MEPTSATWSEEQRAEMADGTVSSEEYHEAFRRYATCLSEKGYGVVFVTDRGIRIDYSVPDTAVQAGADAYCYEREFRGVDTLWQLSNEDTAQTERYRSCLIQLGMDIPDTQQAMVEALLGAGVDPGTCEELTQ